MIPKRQPAQNWTTAELAILTDWLTRGHTAATIAQRLGRPLTSVQNKMKRSRLGPLIQARATITRVVRDDDGAKVIAPEETAGEPSDQFLERILKRTTYEVSRAKAEPYATLRIASDQPIALSISSDWHLSVTGPTDVEGLLAYADAIRTTPRAYAIGVGDLTDNPIKHRPTSVTEVPEELRLLDIVVGRFGGKLLATTSGNHDDWTKAFSGIDNLRNLAEKHRIHYAPDELIYQLEIVDPTDLDHITARWVIATRHKFRRHSNMNLTHACWRWFEENAHNWPQEPSGAILLPDAIAIGHNHVAAVETRTYDRGDVVACRMGSWQRTSPYTRAGGWALMPPTAPTIVFPHIRDGTQQPTAYADYRKALHTLQKA